MAERRKARKKAATNAPKAAARGATPKATKPDGSISATIYETVEKLVAANGLSRAAAFRQLAKQTGRKEGTVAVNYYYAAKKRGAKLRKRRPASKAPAGARTAGQPRVLSLLESLAELVRRQAAELDSLRRENGRFVEMQKLFA